VRNVVRIRNVVQQMRHVVMMKQALYVPGQIPIAVAMLPVSRLRCVVLMVRVPRLVNLVNVVGLVTVNQIKGVVMISVFH
jgi:hypothetical protein